MPRRKTNPIKITNLQNTGSGSGWIKETFYNLALMFLAAILFAASHPNLLFYNGLPFFAWFAYIPVVILINRNNVIQCIGWGALYGFAAYGFYAYWLSAFHPLAGVIVYCIYIVYFAVTFPILKLACILFPKRSYLAQWVVWLAYEYLSMQGFTGFPYGITGYTQWRITPLIQIASLAGVWGVNVLVTFPSFWLAGAIINTSRENVIPNREGAIKKEEKNLPQTHTETKSRFNFYSLIRAGSHRFAVKNLKNYFLQEKIPAIIWGAALAASLVFGFVTLKDYSDTIAAGNYSSAQIALIQHNTDPWEASKASSSWLIDEAYRKDLRILKRLSDAALNANPDIQLVVWSETAFVPRIYWHTTYREEQNSWEIVRELLEYLSSKDVPFLLGNDDARKDPAVNPNASDQHRVDYNAVMYFEKGNNTKTYRKLHLVPFTEHFPYRKQFPMIYDWLVSADTHFWEKGNEAAVFTGPGFTFSTPICFEDTFGYLSREFVRGGADVIINLSNDAWSNSVTAQYQHLSMAVFRAVENYRPMARSTASGQTCAVDPLGRIISMAPSFEETYLDVSIPLIKKDTLYTKFGDYLGVFSVWAAIAILLFGAVCYTMRKLKARTERH